MHYEDTDAVEVNFDGLVGPTHNYGGLSFGNIASMEHSRAISHPKDAALQGLEKMYQVLLLGGIQGVFPPHERPYIPLLKRLGYQGRDEEILEKVALKDPSLLIGVSSSSSMWSANAATVSPSSDALDEKVHFTPANLISNFHRSFESEMSGKILQQIFHDPRYFVHHLPLPAHTTYADEGAANHSRFCTSFGDPGIQLFVFGEDEGIRLTPGSQRFLARQTKAASKAIARMHLLDPEKTLFFQQSPEAIDEGAFHNDVVALGHQNLFFYHEKAFLNEEESMIQLKTCFKQYVRSPLLLLRVSEREIPLREAIKTYLFNSQFLTLQNGKIVWIAPQECQTSETVLRFLNKILSSGIFPIQSLLFQNLQQSMFNGGGPACLRLRIVLTPQERHACHSPAFLTPALYEQLKQWIHAHYRETLTLKELADPQLLHESRTALDKLTHILKLNPLYSFQK